MLVHSVWVRLGRGSSNFFFCLFIALQNQGKKGSRSCQLILFLILPDLQYQEEAEKGGRGNVLVPGQSIACETSPPWLVSAQIDNGTVKASAASAFAAEVLLGALPAPAPRYGHRPPSCPPAGSKQGLPQGHPSLGPAGAAQGPPRRYGSRRPGVPQRAEHAVPRTQSLPS